MTKIKNISMTIVWTYVAIASVVGLVELTIETVDEINHWRKTHKK